MERELERGSNRSGEEGRIIKVVREMYREKNRKREGNEEDVGDGDREDRNRSEEGD